MSGPPGRPPYSGGQQPQYGQYSSNLGPGPTTNMNGSRPGGGAGMGAPARPARSVRRPHGEASPRSSLQNPPGSAGPTSEPRAGPTRSGTRARRLHEAIQQDERSRSSRPGTSMSHRSASPETDEERTERGDDLGRDDEPRLPARGPQGSPVLQKAVQAFASASAGARSSDRDRRPSASSAAGPRVRRGAVGVQGQSARARAGTKSQVVPSTPAFREMERVLAEVAKHWPELMPPDAASGGQGDGEDEEDFDPVTTALALVDPEGDPARFRSFMATKDALSRSLDSSIRQHYRAFDNSVSAYNGLLSNLSYAQKNAVNLRGVLEEVRETLGKGRTELGVLQARRTELAEMDKLLVTIGTLKNVPDRLEALMSDKRFLAASVLLMRSLKTISRGEMAEIAAIADLRSYLQSQENLMLEYLTEELHNHLYLKTFYTDTRWRAHVPGQTDLPAFEVETVVPSVFDRSREELSPDAANRKQTRLDQFLAHLSQRTSNGSNLNDELDEAVPLEALLGTTAQSDEQALTGMAGITKSSSTLSFNTLTPSGSVNAGLGIPGMSGASSEAPSGKSQDSNPEHDSFLYIESILESLAYLGKLSSAMDSVLQRAPIEIYNLIEATVVEVDERNDPLRRSSARLARLGNSPKFMFSGTFPAQGSTAYSLLVRSSVTSGFFPGDDSLSTSILEMNTEILMDFFWTVFSKLDAVLQGFRVLHEVNTSIAARKGFKDTALTSRSGALAYSLTDVWRPIQIEVQSILHDYLVDEHDGMLSGRSTVASINEALRNGRPKETSKSLFKFSEMDSKSTSRRLKPYEDSLNRSLKASVPGLVFTLAEGASAGPQASSGLFSASSQTPAMHSHADNRSAITGRTHRMLVPPSAFNVDNLVLPTMKFLERAQSVLPSGVISVGQGNALKRYSGIMDDETVDRLREALEQYDSPNNAHETTSQSQ